LNNAEQAVLEANRRFYEAFESLDIERMAAVWLREDWAECVHPGWELLRGWEEIRDSWVRILDRKSTRLNSSHPSRSRMPSSA